MARSCILILALVLGVWDMIYAQQREILIDDESPIFKVGKHEEYESEESGEDVVEHAPCHLEYQVMKRVVGTCIKLGKSARGCVAGNYLHPLHPECM